MGPEHQLCILAGSPMSMILCRRENHYEVIGDCFVNGIMEGEAVEALRSSLSHEGPFGTIKMLPTLDDFMNSHPIAAEVVRKFQEETPAVFHQQTKLLKEIEFDIR
ncbi:hypothetical protein BGZ60DRAFT_423081 [Tricladium varicosporioides]|nr:hypothetical protein BGZ60DRAFT_423081 [Hymenoscyphus varicosporioides]